MNLNLIKGGDGSSPGSAPGSRHPRHGAPCCWGSPQLADSLKCWRGRPYHSCKLIRLVEQVWRQSALHLALTAGQETVVTCLLEFSQVFKFFREAITMDCKFISSLMMGSHRPCWTSICATQETKLRWPWRCAKASHTLASR